MSVTFLEPLTPADFINVETDTAHGANAEKAAGDLSAELRYSERRYAEDIVILRRLKLAGWPANVPYVCFSHIRGGILVACELLKDWNEGKISFTPATPEDIANAKRDPATVHPNYRRPVNAISAPLLPCPSAMRRRHPDRRWTCSGRRLARAAWAFWAI